MKIIETMNLLHFDTTSVTKSEVKLVLSFYDIFKISTQKPCLVLRYHRNISKNTHFSAQV